MKTTTSKPIDAVTGAARQPAGPAPASPSSAPHAATVPDSRASADALQRMQQLANQSGPASQLKHYAAIMGNARSAAAHRALQLQAANAVPGAGKAGQNQTGLPDQLKSGIESLSGMTMDHVKVHYNSAEPAQLQALAFARGSDIHVAPGQERHVPHEAWHVVQQAQGRVRPTLQMRGDVPVNDDAALEHEADTMGAQAMRHQAGAHDDAASATPRNGATAVQLVKGEAGELSRDGKRKSPKVIRMEEFGDRNRVHTVNPNKVNERLASDQGDWYVGQEDHDEENGIWRPSKEENNARPEDPPMYQPFRKAFHEVHNRLLAMQRDAAGMDQGYLQGIAQFLLQVSKDVKTASVQYKTDVRRFIADYKPVEQVKQDYLAKLQTQTMLLYQTLAQMLANFRASELGGMEVTPEQEAMIGENQSKRGEEIWRERWAAAIQAVNSILDSEWQVGKEAIKQWVTGQHNDDERRYMDAKLVGEIDYIGSLAKGYKSAPKQYIRYMPEKFDVDANLDAPPLAVFAMSKGAALDRGSVKAGEHVPPLATFENKVNARLEKVAGIDVDDPFEVFVRANVADIVFGTSPQVDTAHRTVALAKRLQQIRDRIWWLRTQAQDLAVYCGLRFVKMGLAVIADGDIALNVDREAGLPYTDGQLTMMEVVLSEFEAQVEPAQENDPQADDPQEDHPDDDYAIRQGYVALPD